MTIDRYLLAVLGVVVLAAPAASAPAADYRGSARPLLPNTAQSHYDRRTVLVQLPTIRGRFLNAWKAVYADQGPGEPRVTLTVYVYPSPSIAASTYRDTCPSGLACKSESVKDTPDLMFEGVAYRKGNARCAFVAGTWSTLLMRVVTCATKAGYTSEKLKFDAAFLIGFVYGKAKSTTRQAPPPRSNCDPSYPTVCIPPYPPDLDCADVPYVDFEVRGSDPHGFDGDNDGVGCES